MANAWGTLALEKFSAAFERALADGTAGAIDLRRGTVRWEAVPPRAAR